MSVMFHLATLGHSVHLHFSGTADELGDDHWMLLEERQWDSYSISESKLTWCAVCVDFSLGFSFFGALSSNTLDLK